MKTKPQIIIFTLMLLASGLAVADTPRLRAGDHVDVFVTFDPAQVSADSDPTLTVAILSKPFYVPMSAIQNGIQEHLEAK